MIVAKISRKMRRGICFKGFDISNDAAHVDSLFRIYPCAKKECKFHKVRLKRRSP
jgi:hypothetical protein